MKQLCGHRFSYIIYFHSHYIYLFRIQRLEVNPMKTYIRTDWKLRFANLFHRARKHSNVTKEEPKFSQIFHSRVAIHFQWKNRKKKFNAKSRFSDLRQTETLDSKKRIRFFFHSNMNSIPINFYVWLLVLLVDNFQFSSTTCYLMKCIKYTQSKF